MTIWTVKVLTYPPKTLPSWQDFTAPQRDYIVQSQLATAERNEQFQYSRWLMAKTLKEISGRDIIPHMDPKNPQTIYHEKDFKCSLAHTPGAVAVIFAHGISADKNQACFGVDIEWANRAMSEGIERKFRGPLDQMGRTVNADGHIDSNLALWSIKEAVYKAHYQTLGALSFLDIHIRPQAKNSSLHSIDIRPTHLLAKKWEHRNSEEQPDQLGEAICYHLPGASRSLLLTGYIHAAAAQRNLFLQSFSSLQLIPIN
jgi:phosphopantetheinyl transferase